MGKRTLPHLPTQILLIVLVGLLLGCSTRSHDQVPGPVTNVKVTRNSSGLQLDYALPRPEAAFRFNPSEHRSAASVIRVLTPDLTLSHAAVVGPSAFRSFSLAVRPDIRRVDATYAVLARVGENGFLLYAPALAGDPAEGRTRFDFVRSTGDIVLGGDSGFVFIGPSSYVAHHGPLALATPPDLPDPLRATIRNRATALLGYYSGRLGGSPPQAPVIVVSYDARSQNAEFVGDVAPNGVVLLQLTAAFQSEASGVDALLSRFLAHELFHLWNGHSYRDIAGVNGHWLREGSAEYASWMAAEALWPEGQSLEERITGQLAYCMDTLGPDALVQLEDQRSQTTRYSCGAIAQWLADVAVRRAGPGDVLDVWADLLAGRSGYDVASFETAMRARAAPHLEPLTSVLYGKGRDRWPQIFDTLRSWGVHVDQVAPGAASLREAALQTILREACTGGATGFETMGLSEPPNAVILRTEPMGGAAERAECGPLGGDPQLLAVNGHNALGDWGPILQDVEAACERGAEITLTLRRGMVEESASIRCSHPALTTRTQYRVRNALPNDPGA